MALPELNARGMTANPGEHSDADTLAAFSEMALSTQWRTEVYAHLAECEACREWLSAHSLLRDVEWEPATRKPVRPFLSASTNFQRTMAVAGIACSLLFFATVSPRLFRIRMPPQPVTAARLETFLPESPAATCRASATSTRATPAVRGPRRHVPKTVDLLRFAPWRAAWLQSVALTSSPFKDPRPLLPGPWGQARLSRNMRFVTNFSIEDAMVPSLNQIAVRTSSGERWITLDRFGAHAWQIF